ncbi:hypothetical protein [Endozoicomonas sp. ALC066]|uniref:hypothetical protein n=1 Tax=Endozoicomonas sp. ALC066 TaxID=3403078 RepID=UPI003BB7B9B5
MSARVKVISTVVAACLPAILSASELENTGTVDSLVRQGQVEYQLQEEERRRAAELRANPKKEAKTDKPRPTAFDAMIERTGNHEIKEYVDRLHFVGAFSDGVHSEAQIYYKGSVNAYEVGESMPRGFDLIEISGRSIKVKNRSTGQVQTLFMRSITSIEQEKKEFNDNLQKKVQTPGRRMF